MNSDDENPSRPDLAGERMKQIQKRLVEEEEELKQLDEEIQKAGQKSKKVIRDPEP